ncbi:MAG TPA: ATPase [Mariniphaga anaerophila]|uniref:ATPase n=1 Tax=Mariniphaga anaerophila TaxID=1484053 RepID=A0A831LJX4_9BACT|nr:ATPase [Mariniphaga anaerophila]
MNYEPKIIVITGAESTGKSALTQWLANHFQAPFIPEYARDYIEKLGRKYLFSDVEFIARKQIQQLNELQKTNSPLIFSDTWLIITKIWFEEVYGRKPEWLEQKITNTKIDLFLVCDTDLPWIPDPVRENGGEKRLYLQKKYIETIEEYGFNYKIIRGKDDLRFTCALKYISKMI